MSGPKLGLEDRAKAQTLYEECCENPEDFAYRYVALEHELTAVKAERDALRKDAKRYRWLRMNRIWIKGNAAVLPGLTAMIFDGTVDAAIDAAMQEQKP